MMADFIIFICWACGRTVKLPLISECMPGDCICGSIGSMEAISHQSVEVGDICPKCGELKGGTSNWQKRRGSE